MTEEERLVSQIRQFLHGFSQEKNPEIEELADQFADLCNRINERLGKCVDFLNQGMRSEAVQAAEVPPPLLQLVEIVTFTEITKWRNLCNDLGMTVPPPLDMDAVDRLRTECSKEEFLSPLLQTYRRLVHQGNLEERIAVLRRIRELDPENPVWTENLAPLEHARQETLVKQARIAIAQGDLEQVQTLYEELTDPRRVVDPPKQIVGKMAALLRRAREQQALDEGDRLALAMDKARQNQEFDTLEPLLRKWKRLEKFPDFHPSEEMIQCFARAQNWFETEKKRRTADRRFDQAVETVRNLVRLPLPDENALRNAWIQLQATGRKPPAQLTQEVDQAWERIRRDQAARRRKRIARNTFLAILALTLLSAGAWIAWNTTRKVKIRSTVHALLQQKDYSGLQDYLEALRRKQPAAMQMPAIAQARRQIETWKQARLQRRKQLEAILTQLQAIREKRYNAPEADIRRILKRAETLADTPASREKVSGWNRAWQLWKAQRQKERDDAFNQLVDGLTRDLAAAPNYRNGPIDAEQKALADVESRLRRAAAMTFTVSEPLRAKLPPLQNLFTKWKNDFLQRAEKQRRLNERRRRTLHALPATLPDIDAYAQLIRGYLADFPNTPSAVSLKRALDNLLLYQDAAALSRFHVAALPFGPTELKRAEALAAKLPGKTTSIWAPDLHRAIRWSQANTELRNGLKKLTNLDFYNLHVFYARKIGEKDWEPIYYPDQILRRKSKLSDGRQITLYWGRVYRATPEEEKPWLDHIKLSTSTYEVKIKRFPTEDLIPAAKFIRQALNRAQTNPDATLLILDLMHRLAKEQPEIQPVPRMILLRSLGNLLAATLGDSTPEFLALHRLFPNITLQVNWINRTHPAVAEAERKIRAELPALPDFQAIAHRIQLARTMLRLALDRRVRCVGMVAKDPTTASLTPKLRISGLRTAWIITLGPQQQRRVFLRALRRNQAGNFVFTEEARNSLFFGQLLFAPSDGTPAEELLKAYLKPGEKPPFWPDAWPINARTIP